MPNMKKEKTPMPTREPALRARDFEEVATGYTADMAKEEAARCLSCKKPLCMEGCPVQIDIPGFLREAAAGDFEAAYRVIEKDSSLPAVCGRVCPQESQCEGRCVRSLKGESVGIGRVERFVADRHREKVEKPSRPAPNGHRVAVVGSGPSGLTCAGDLARRGYAVTVFEALHTPGGVLVYGIPEFRLPKAIVADEIEGLRALGVTFETNTVIGRTLTVDELLGEEGFEAVFLGSGAGLPRFMGIPGENLKGVFSANEYLTRVNLMKAFCADSDTPIFRSRRVAVVGGGNVAMDAARTALRLGAEKVFIVYRRSMEELPARREEVEHAMEEGVEFRLLTNPVEILGYRNAADPRDPQNGSVTGIRCISMKLGEPDERGRRRPVEIPGSEHELPLDTVIMAIGTSPNPLLRATTEGLATDRHGCIVADPGTGATSLPGVFAGGDAVTGAATVILAMGAGKAAAAAMDRYIKGK